MAASSPAFSWLGCCSLPDSLKQQEPSLSMWGENGDGLQWNEEPSQNDGVEACANGGFPKVFDGCLLDAGDGIRSGSAPYSSSAAAHNTTSPDVCGCVSSHNFEQKIPLSYTSHISSPHSSVSTTNCGQKDARRNNGGIALKRVRRAESYYLQNTVQEAINIMAKYEPLKLHLETLEERMLLDHINFMSATWRVICDSFKFLFVLLWAALAVLFTQTSLVSLSSVLVSIKSLISYLMPNFVHLLWHATSLSISGYGDYFVKNSFVTTFLRLTIGVACQNIDCTIWWLVIVAVSWRFVVLLISLKEMQSCIPNVKMRQTEPYKQNSRFVELQEIHRLRNQEMASMDAQDPSGDPPAATSLQLFSAEGKSLCRTAATATTAATEANAVFRLDSGLSHNSLNRAISRYSNRRSRLSEVCRMLQSSDDDNGMRTNKKTNVRQSPVSMQHSTSPQSQTTSPSKIFPNEAATAKYIQYLRKVHLNNSPPIPHNQWNIGDLPICARFVENRSVIEREIETLEFFRSNSPLEYPIGPLTVNGKSIIDSGLSAVHHFESPLFKGKLLLRAWGLPSSSNTSYFCGKKRLTQAVVQGKFKRPFAANEVLTGFLNSKQFVGLPNNLIMSVAMAVARKLNPSMVEDISSDSPYMLTPLIAACQKLHVANVTKTRSHISSESEGLFVEVPNILDFDIPEDCRLLGGDFVKDLKLAFKPESRKYYFSNFHNLCSMRFDPKFTYTFDVYQHLFNFATYRYDIGIFKLDITNFINRQPVEHTALVNPTLSKLFVPKDFVPRPITGYSRIASQHGGAIDADGSGFDFTANVPTQISSTSAVSTAPTTPKQGTDKLRSEGPNDYAALHSEETAGSCLGPPTVTRQIDVTPPSGNVCCENVDADCGIESQTSYLWKVEIWNEKLLLGKSSS